MSEIITKDDGTEVEVFTQEELDTQKEEAIDQFKADNPDKSEEMDQLKEDIKEKEEENKAAKAELEKLGKKDFNFSKMREKNKIQENELDKLKGEMNDKLDGILDTVNEGKKSDIINDLAGDDKELKKKINFHFDRIKDEANTKEELEGKIKDAYTLATGGKGEPKGNFLSSEGAGGSVIKQEMSAETKDLGNKLGITDDDFKKLKKKGK